MQMDGEAQALIRRLAVALLPAARERLGADGDEALDRIADVLALTENPAPDPVALLFAAGAALRVTTPGSKAP